MIPLAHAGHWIETVAYLVPVVGVVLMLGITIWRDRRRGAGGPDQGPETPS